MIRKTYCLCFACLLLVVASSCTKRTQPAAVIPTIQLGTAAITSDDPGTRYSLSLTPFRQADLAFKSSGIVDQIREVRGADGRMREITMGDLALAGSQLGHVRLVDYQQKIDAAKGSLDQAIGSLASAKASQEFAKVDFERAANLYQEASMTKENYDHAVQQQNAPVAAVHQPQASIASAKADLAQTQLALHDATVLSPFDALVVSRHVELGTLVAPTTAPFTVLDIHTLKSNFTIPHT